MKNLNDTLDRDAVCIWSTREHYKCEPECRARGGVIPAGEAHYRWDGVRNEDGSPARICAHCVRRQNWDHYRDKKLTTKIRIEFSDGTAQELTGEAALDWDETVSAQGVFAWVHGVACKPFPWESK